MFDLHALPARSIIRLEQLVFWMFGPTLPVAHVFFGGLAAGWALALCLNPALFDAGVYAAINWLPDPAWIVGHTLLVILHGVSVWRPTWQRLGAAACLGSSWTWIVLGLTFGLANGFTPGFLVYFIIGLLAAAVALYIAWRPRTA